MIRTALTPTRPSASSLAAVLLALAVVSGSAAAQGAPEPPRTPAPAAEDEKGSAAARRRIDDAGIDEAVEQQLLIDPGVESWKIDVATTEGIVTLSGTAADLLSLDRAAKIAETVKGVRGVVNRIRLDHVTRADDELRRDVVDALVQDPVADSYEITVSVEDGNARLEGTVDSWAERSFAERIAMSVRGLEGVTNAIEVRGGEPRRDGEIETEIKQRLLWDRFIDGLHLDVEVTEGNVALSGAVSSAAEKRRARAKCFVNGVRVVDDDGVEVDPDLADRTRDTAYVTRSESEVEAAVKDALLYDPRVSSYVVDVAVTNGMVTLRGDVRDLRAKRAAADDARAVTGVYVVRNHLKVRSAGGRSDDAIERLVRNGLRRDPWVESYEILVDSDEGVVTLRGTVDTTFEKMRAEDVAARVADVVRVKNKVRVDYDHDVVTHDPFVDDWYYDDYPWYRPEPAVTTRSDWRIRRDIEDELFWSPFVDEADIVVSVDDGTATLTGTVDDWAEYRAARENALEGGATRVVNRLEVAGRMDWPF